MSINNDLRKAKNILMEYWPLNAFIAINPLWSLRNEDFFEITSKPIVNGLMPINYYYNQYLQKNITTDDLKNIFYLTEKRSLSDTEINRWIKNSLNIDPEKITPILFCEQLEEYKFQKPIIWIKEHISALLRDYFGNAQYRKINLINFWHQEKQIKSSEINSLHSLSIEKAIDFLIKKMNIPTTHVVNYLETIYINVYGWSSLMNWRNQHSNNPWLPGSDACDIILLQELPIKFMITLHYIKLIHHLMLIALFGTSLLKKTISIN